MAALLLSGCSPSQEAIVECYYLTKSAQRTLPKNDLYVINVNTKEGSRLDVYFQIPYSRLHFEKDQDVFNGSYSVSFVLRGEDETVIRTRDIDRTVVARTYAESISSRHDAFLEVFAVTPGVYTMSIAVSDNRSKLQYRRRFKVEARNFAKADFSVSDYLLFQRAHPGRGIITITPLFPAELSFTQDSIGVFQELYHVQRGDTILLRLSCGMMKQRGPTEGNVATLSPPYNPNLPECGRVVDSVYYTSDSAFVALDGGTIQMFQYFPKPPKGVVTLTRTVYHFRKGAVDSNVTTQRIPVYNPTFPKVRNIDEEIAAISFISRPNDYESLRTAATPAERTTQLDRFWEAHGGTIRRKEFLDRVTEANELFSSCTEGSKTPMGIVYIVCGPPDYIECQGKMNEVWYYDLGGNSAFPIPFRQSYNVDFDRYYELVPFSLNEFTWQQFVDRWRRQ